MIELPHKTTSRKRRARDMKIDAETAMILSGAIGAGSSLLVFLITRVFDARSEKRKEKERFFYEIYKRRLALYRKILKQLYLFSDITSSSTSPFESPQEFGTITVSFLELSDTGALVASPAAAEALDIVSDFIRNSVIEGKALRGTGGVDAFVSFMAEHSALLRRLIREETCPEIVDKYLSGLTEARPERQKPIDAS
jgi:hypothetical protein